MQKNMKDLPTPVRSSENTELADNEEPKLSAYTIIRVTQVVETFDALGVTAADARSSPNREHRKTTTYLLNETCTKKDS